MRLFKNFSLSVSDIFWPGNKNIRNYNIIIITYNGKKKLVVYKSTKVKYNTNTKGYNKIERIQK